ncbi:hypothetical protein [Mucilaginibacter sp.]
MLVLVASSIYYICIAIVKASVRNPDNDKLHTKSIFGLSDYELHERLRPTADRITQEIWMNNGYITYFNAALCPDTRYMIHEYRDTKELVFVKPNGAAWVVKLLEG